MRRFDRSIQRIAVAVAVLASALQMHATFAQEAPARAPEIVTENEGDAAPERGLRWAPADEAAQARRAAAMQNALMMGRGTSSTIVVEGEFVYVLYGTHLCQFSVDGLKLMASVDLRDIIEPDRAARRLGRLGGDWRRRGDAGVAEPLGPRDGDAPATPVENADTPAPEAGGAPAAQPE